MAAIRSFCVTILLTAVLTGCSDSSDSGGESSAPPIAEVALAHAERGSVAETIPLFGAAEYGATGQYALSSPVEAFLSSIDAPVGSAVRRGQLIATLTPSPATRLDLTKASSDARAANDAYARAQRLRADGLVSDAEVEVARASAQAARATLASLSARNQSLRLYAPAAGYVQRINVSLGDQLTAGAPVATIGQGSDLRARFGVDPAVARRLSPGQPLTIKPAGGGVAITVPILSIDPSADPRTRLASVFAQIPAGSQIGPGEALEARVSTSTASEAVTIPYSALLDEGGQPYVFVVQNGVAHRREVRVGATSADRAAIADGVRLGDLVVTQGGTALEDGMKVRAK